MQVVCMAVSPFEHTLIETRIHIKQNRKTHKTDAKKCLCAIHSSLLQETSDTSDNSYVNNTGWAVNNAPKHIKQF